VDTSQIDDQFIVNEDPQVIITSEFENFIAVIGEDVV